MNRTVQFLTANQPVKVLAPGTGSPSSIATAKAADQKILVIVVRAVDGKSPAVIEVSRLGRTHAEPDPGFCAGDSDGQ